LFSTYDQQNQFDSIMKRFFKSSYRNHMEKIFAVPYDQFDKIANHLKPLLMSMKIDFTIHARQVDFDIIGSMESLFTGFEMGAFNVEIPDNCDRSSDRIIDFARRLNFGSIVCYIANTD
ncbi:hypothetical protein PFISCL1PPCAC_1068, partial [Pristionchus fissidentatus]